MFDEFGFIIKVFIFSLFSAIGGMLSYTVKTLDANHKLSLGRLIVQGSVACFFGIIILLLCTAHNISIEYTGAIVGVTSWLGADATIAIALRWMKLPGATANKGPDDGNNS